MARPTAAEICNHPFFWDSMKRLLFLCDLSDRLERADSDSSISNFEIERNAIKVVGTSWDTKLDPGFLNYVTKYRKYDASSVKDCLRLIRNKNHHFDELPDDLKERVCKNQEELLKYFESNFPELLMHCYNTCREYLVFNDNLIEKYKIPSKVGKGAIDNKNTNTVNTNNIKALSSNASKSDLQSPKKEYKKTLKSQLSSDSENTNTPQSTPEKKDGISVPKDVVVWENSTVASTYQCRGWMRCEDEWIRGKNKSKKIDFNLAKCAKDGRFRTRLCNHWDESQGTFCAMRKRNKCDFAHGPIELRVKEEKRKKRQWGVLVDSKGNNSDPQHSGGINTYRAARSIETERKKEGKVNTGSKQKKGRKKNHKK